MTTVMNERVIDAINKDLQEFKNKIEKDTFEIKEEQDKFIKIINSSKNALNKIKGQQIPYEQDMLFFYYDEKTKGVECTAFSYLEDEYKNCSGTGILYDIQSRNIFSYGVFKDIKLNGKGVKYYLGCDKIFSKGTFKNNKLDGEGEEYFPNGNFKRKGTFKDGYLDGEGEEYFVNGNLKRKGIFKDGCLNGEGKEYYDKENYYMEGTFKDGKLDGKGKINFLDSTGNISFCINSTFKNGALANDKEILPLFTDLLKKEKYNEITCLLKNGIIDFKKVKEKNILMGIMQNCSDKLVDALIEGRVDFNICCDEKSKQTLFMLLCKNKNITLDCFKKILENTVNKKFINTKDSLGQTPLFHLIKFILFSVEDKNERNAFIEKIKLLIEYKADIFTIDELMGANPFILLCNIKEIDSEFVKSLIEGKEEIFKSKNNGGGNVLHRCIDSANFGVIELLLENGLSITAKNNNDTTPLMILCKNKNVTVEFLKKIFEKYPKEIKKNIKKQDKFGKNALCYAADSCNINVMNFLVDEGVDTTILTDNGTPLNILVKNIKDRKVHLTDEFIESFERLIKNKKIQKSINIVQGQTKQTVLQNALESGMDMKIIKILIDNGADIKQENTNGITPFMLLCGKCDVKIEYLKELIEKNNITKKDINKKDIFGNSILFNIVNNIFDIEKIDDAEEKNKYKEINKNRKNILKLLISKGADINMKNKDGKTISDIANEKNDIELVEFLKSLEKNKQNTNNIQNNKERAVENVAQNQNLAENDTQVDTQEVQNIDAQNTTNKEDTNSNRIQTVNDSKNNTTLKSNSSNNNDILNDLKPVTERIATPHVSKARVGVVKEEKKNEGDNSKTQIVDDMKNSIEQKTAEPSTKTEQNETQNTNNIQNNKEQAVENVVQNQNLAENEKEKTNITQAKTAENDTQVDTQEVQNIDAQNTTNKEYTNSKDVLFMLCLMLVVMNKNRYCGNSTMFRY